jgi:hypothetical protein
MRNAQRRKEQEEEHREMEGTREGIKREGWEKRRNTKRRKE